MVVTTEVGKIAEQSSARTASDLIASGLVQMVINTPSGRSARADGHAIRIAATVHKVSCLTTMSAASAAVKGIADSRANGWSVRSLQELHG
jgi:carbamoyl-phosphate synthase large subunit